MLTVKQTVAALKERDLFKEIIVDGQWLYDVPEKIADLEFKELSYDSRAIKPQTLFICKVSALTRSIWWMQSKKAPQLV